jgi:hypothetical protein
MLKKKSLLLVALLLWLTASVGCGTQIPYAVPVAMNPTVVQITKGEIATVTIILSKQHQGDEPAKMEVTFGNSDLVRPETGSSTVSVPAGAQTVTFNVQGVAPGTTFIRAQIGDYSTRTSIVVLDQ